MTKNCTFFKKIENLDHFLNRIPVNAKKKVFYSLIRSKAVETYFWKVEKTGTYLCFFSSRFFVRRLSQSRSLEAMILGRHVSEYLLNNGNIDPQKVKNIFLKANISDIYIMQDFFHLSSKIPTFYLKELIPKAKEILTNRNADKYLYGSEIINWVEKFSTENLTGSALDLMDFLTRPIPSEKGGNADTIKELGFLDRNYRELLTKDQYDDLFNKKIEKLRESSLEVLVDIIERNLALTLDLDQDKDELVSIEWINPYSSGTEIFADELKVILYFIIRDLLVLGASKKNTKIIDKVIGYFSHDCISMKRMAIYVASVNPSVFKSNILSCLQQDEFINDYSLSNDLINIINKNSGLFSQDEIKTIFDKILTIIPDLPYSIEVSSETWTNVVRHRLLKPLLNFSDDSFANVFAKIEKSNDEFIASQKAKVTAINPADVDNIKLTLSACPISEFWDKVISLRESDVDFMDYLSDFIIESVKKNPELLLDEKLLFISKKSYLIISRILSHISEIENHLYFSDKYFNHFLKLTHFITELEFEESQETLYTSLENIRRSSLLYLIKAFTLGRTEVSNDQLTQVYEIIHFYLVLSSQKEYESLAKMSPLGIISVIHNDIKSTALRLVIEIGRWESAQLSSAELTDGKRKCSNKIFEVIEGCLTEQNESVLLHAVCGLMLPTLYYLDPEFVKETIEIIFPKNNLEILIPSFNAYLYNSGFDSKLFPELLAYYKLFLFEFHLFDNSDSLEVSTVKSLGVHLLIVTIRGIDRIDSPENLLIQLIKSANKKTIIYIAHLLSSIASKEEANKKVVSDVLYALWKEMLSIPNDDLSTPSDKSNSELFYFMLTLIKIPDQVDLKKYYPLIKGSLGFLLSPFPNYDFLNFLSSKFCQDEKKTVSLLKEYVKTMGLGLYFSSQFNTNLRLLLDRAIESKNESVRNDVKYIVNRLGSLGLYELRTFWNTHFENHYK